MCNKSSVALHKEKCTNDKWAFDIVLCDLSCSVAKCIFVDILHTESCCSNVTLLCTRLHLEFLDVAVASCAI